jgi:hypothetical protein
MSPGAAIIIALRLIVPLLIFRRPLAGGIAAAVTDTIDVVLVSAMNIGGFGDYYHTTDKLLDTYYLSFEFIVAMRWDNMYARWICAALFPYRILGVALFELTGHRVMLFIFPNLFENWWLWCAFTMAHAPQWVPRSFRSSAVALVLLLIPKMGQEYVLHYAEVKPWDWIKREILRGKL